MGDIQSVSVEKAWDNGTNLRTAVRKHEKEVRWWLWKEVGKLCKDVDANKTLSTDEEFKFCCRSILDEFPALKVEEVRLCFDMIRQGKFGKLYERLKTQEILDALRRYEGEVRAPYLERQLHNRKHERVEVHDMVWDAVRKLKVKEPTKPEGSGLGSRVKKRLGTDETS